MDNDICRMTVVDQQLVKAVQSVVDGASIHTRNKAVCYYQYAELKPEKRAVLDAMMRKSLEINDWAPLRQYMRYWF